MGRWGTVDPLAEKYYSISPYTYVANNPINAIDFRGDSITTIINRTITNTDGTTSIKSDKYYYGKNANDSYGFIDVNGQIYSGGDQFINDLTSALGDLRNGGKGQELVDNLINSTNNVSVVRGNRNATGLNGDYITWNPNSLTGGMNTIGNENRPAFIGLGHEMAHIQDIWSKTIDRSPWLTVGNTVIPNSEKYATHIENQLRAEHKIPLRTHYGINISTGVRKGLENSRIITGSSISKFYYQSNGSSRGIPLLRTPYIYK